MNEASAQEPASTTYLRGLRQLLERLEQAPQMEAAAETMAHSVRRGGIAHLFGSGHSMLPALKSFLATAASWACTRSSIHASSGSTCSAHSACPRCCSCKTLRATPTSGSTVNTYETVMPSSSFPTEGQAPSWSTPRATPRRAV